MPKKKVVSEDAVTDIVSAGEELVETPEKPKKRVTKKATKATEVAPAEAEKKAPAKKVSKTKKIPKAELKRSSMLDKALKKPRLIFIKPYSFGSIDDLGNCLRADLDGASIVVPAAEFDVAKASIPVMWNTVGKDIPVILESFDDTKNLYIASRKKAQVWILNYMLEHNDYNKLYDGEIVSFTGHGALVKANNVVGLLKSSDWTKEHIQIREVLKVGDHLNVKFKKGNVENFHLEWMPEELYAIDGNPDYEKVKVGNIYKGKVIKFVEKDNMPKRDIIISILSGIRVACNEPDTTDILPNSEAIIKIVKNVKNEDGRTAIRGRFVL